MDTFDQNSVGRQKESNGNKTDIPRYQLIACDVASKIAEGTYPVGTKLYARSALASQYGVSSETARRAICILTDLGIVESTKGSGITVLSEEKAINFVRQFGEMGTMADLKNALRDGLQRYQDDLENIADILDKIKEKASHYYTTNPFVPYQLRLGEECPHLGKTLQELNFWQMTLATVVAIGRNGETILSPGPFESLKANDTVFYIGKHECIERVNRLLTHHREEC